MSDEIYKGGAIILSVLLSRLWSMWEHRKTGKQVQNIYYLMNGELTKKLAEAREEGKQEGIKEARKHSL